MGLSPDPAAEPIVLHGHEDAIYVVAISSDYHWLITDSRDVLLACGIYSWIN